ncbi:MAG TPA: hypothetical protein VEA35_00575 [Ramlibacter sp.]|nr:hypothetical protein [Ramlibacter sp.]
MSDTDDTKRKIVTKAKNVIRFWPSGLLLFCLAFMPASCNKGERNLMESVVGLIDAHASAVRR